MRVETKDGRVMYLGAKRRWMREQQERKLSDMDLNALSEYLNNPVETGLWRLSADWIVNSGISEVVWGELEKEFEGKDVLTILSGKRERKIKVDENWKEEVKEFTQNNMTFYLTLFAYLVESEKGAEWELSEFSATHELMQLVLDLVAIDTIRDRYSEALEHFRKYIWFSEFSPQVRERHLTKFKGGSAITLKGPRTTGVVSMVSWRGEPLKALKRFLELLGKVKSCTLMPVFSPEEEVFAPYFDLLEVAYPQIVTQEHLLPLFRRSISHNREKNYSDCVSAIGLIAEDLLTQVYETLFREQLTKGLTLGQLADEISSRVDAKFRSRESQPSDLSDVYGQIGDHLESDQTTPHDVLKVLRSMVTISIENNKEMQKTIRRTNLTQISKSVFNKRVSRCVDELVKYRNASSHKSRIPIGPWEATRTIYSLMVLMMWWEHEKRLIDWDRSPDQIIRDIVNRNSPATDSA